MSDSGQFGLSESALSTLTSLVMDGDAGAPKQPDAAEPEADAEETDAAEMEAEGDDEEGAEEEAAGQEDEEEAQDEGQTFTVRVNGKDEKVSESELISGYQRHADYTQKTQALASDRRELDGARDTLIQSRRQELDQLQMMLVELQARFPVTRKSVV